MTYASSRSIELALALLVASFAVASSARANLTPIEGEGDPATAPVVAPSEIPVAAEIPFAEIPAAETTTTIESTTIEATPIAPTAIDAATPTVPVVDPAEADAPEEADAEDAIRWLLDALRVVRPTLLGEIDYRVYGREEEGETGFALGRFRLGLIVEPLPWLRAVGTVEWVGERPTLLDAYVAIRALPWLEIVVGYAKPPLFSSFRTEPVHALAFPDRAPVVRSFFVRRDVGVDLRVRPREVPIEAVARIGNGSGSILGNDTPLPAGYAALDLVLGRAWVGAAETDREHGLRLGVSGVVESVRDRDGVFGSEPLGYVFYRSATVSGLRVVGEAHAVGYLGPVRLTLEGAIANEERSRDDDGNPDTPRLPLESISSSGLTAEVAWVVVGTARAPGVAPTAPGSLESWAGGAFEIGARFDALWLGRGASDVAPGGALGGGVSFKWWPLDFLAGTLAGHVLRYESAPSETPGQLWGWDVVLRLSMFWGQNAIPPHR